MPRPFYFSGIPGYCGLKYLSKSSDISDIYAKLATLKNLISDYDIWISQIFNIFSITHGLKAEEAGVGQ
jgi:hypothetical protein